MCVSWSFRFCHLLIVLFAAWTYGDWNLNTKKMFFCNFLKSFKQIPRDRYRKQQNRTFFHSLTYVNPAWSYIKRLISGTSKLSWAQVWHTKLLNLWNYYRRGRNWWRSHIKSHKFNMKEMLNSLHTHETHIQNRRLFKKKVTNDCTNCD